MVTVRKPMPSSGSQQQVVAEKKPEVVTREIVADGVRAVRTPYQPTPPRPSASSTHRETAAELAARIRAMIARPPTGVRSMLGSSDCQPVCNAKRRNFRFR